MSPLCFETKLTCTVPGNVPARSCAGPWAAETGSDQDTGPPQFHQDPAAQRRWHTSTAELDARIPQKIYHSLLRLSDAIDEGGSLLCEKQR